MRLPAPLLPATLTALALALALAPGCGDDGSGAEDPPAAPLEVATSLVPSGLEGRPYAAELIARGGTPPYVWATLGRLPAGLEVEPDRGQLQGTPTEEGSFTFEARVTDAEGREARRDLVLEIEGAGEPVPVLDGTCAAPTALMLSSGAQTLRARLPETADASGLCGLGTAQAAGWFRLDLARASRLRAAAVGDDVRIARVDGTGCPPSAAAGACSTVLAEDLPAGEHRLVVLGPPGAEVALTFELVPEEVPPGPPSCASPESIELGPGRAIVMGSFEDAEDRESGSCSRGPSPEVVYELELDEAADLTLSSSSILYLRAGDCRAGSELLCSDFSGRFLPNLAPGRYFLIVEPRFSGDDAYQVDITRGPATPPAPNASCASAETLDLSSGLAQIRPSFANVPPEAAPTTCGNRERGLYYRFDLAAPAAIEIEQSGGSSASVELLSGTCGSRVALACASFDGICSPTLPAGPYLLRVSSPRNSVAPAQIGVRRVDPRALPANETCATAQALTPGVPVTVDLADAADDGAFPMCSAMGTGEVYYAVDIAERSDVVATVSGFGRSDTTLIASTATCATPTLIACESGAFDPIRLYGVEPGQLGLVVERRFSSSGTMGSTFDCRERREASVTLQVDVTPSPPSPVNDDCTTTSSIAFPRGANSIEMVSGTTRGASDDFSQVLCPFGGSNPTPTPAPDVVYAVDLPSAGRLRVEVTPSTFRQRLVLVPGRCESTAATACSTSGSRLDTGSLPAGRYWLRVDGEAGYIPTDFNLTATFLP